MSDGAEEPLAATAVPDDAASALGAALAAGRRLASMAAAPEDDVEFDADSPTAPPSGPATLHVVTSQVLCDAAGRRGTYSGPVYRRATDIGGAARAGPPADGAANELVPHTAPPALGDAAAAVTATGEHTAADDGDADCTRGTMRYDVDSVAGAADGAAAAAAAAAAPPPDAPLEYAGPWRDGLWHGDDGRLLYASGDVYQGAFRWGRRHGAGTLKWTGSGRQYAGEFRDDLRHGAGSFAWPDGSVYQGEFRHNRRSGRGAYHAPTVSYDGDWEDGVYHGEGVYRYQQNGYDYEYRGAFQHGKPHGRGVLVGGPIESVVQHEGEWRAGQPVASTGDGNTEMTPGGSDKRKTNISVVQNKEWRDPKSGDPALYRGLWDDVLACPVGNGSLDYQQGSILSFEGCFKAPGVFHGRGRLQWRNGDTYEGDFVMGDRQGPCGQYRWADGRHYQGEFLKNLRHGQGRLMYPNNDFYEGHFEAGKRHGAGRFVFADGSLYDGEWKDGVYDGTGTLTKTDGSMYIGQFQAGSAHGKGKAVSPSGTITYEGEWIRGRRADQLEQDKDEVTRSPSDIVTDISVDKGSPLIEDEVEASKAGVGQVGDAASAASPPTIIQTEMTLAHVHRVDGSQPTLLRDWKTRKDPAPRDFQPQIECEAIVDEMVSDAQGNPGRYTGIVEKSSRLPHGVGRMVYDDGKRIHEGFWVEGNKQGHGRCLFTPQGDFHEGEYQMNLRHGPGRYVWKDGRTFAGNYMNDLRHGQGVFVYPNGDRYEGSFAYGVRSGYGRFVFDNRTGSYEGEWSNSKYHGRGLLLWTARTGESLSYEGEFANGMFHGTGIKKDASGYTIEEGEWINGRCRTLHDDDLESHDEEHGATGAPRQWVFESDDSVVKLKPGFDSISLET